MRDLALEARQIFAGLGAVVAITVIAGASYDLGNTMSYKTLKQACETVGFVQNRDMRIYCSVEGNVK